MLMSLKELFAPVTDQPLSAPCSQSSDTIPPEGEEPKLDNRPSLSYLYDYKLLTV
jgi:hypothetical protein